jgi:alpha-L-fucosidase
MYPPRDRNVNYEPESNPEKWNKYVDFTQGQIFELLKDYGKVNILWLDGGWVSKKSKTEIESWYDEQFKESKNGYVFHRSINQDIRMDELVAKARLLQPGLIVVDRAVYGKNQNYLTPENRVPAKSLPYPWESCIISGGGWAHTPDAKYMSGREGVHLLVDIVSKGGNLLLNIAPTPEGEWQQGAYQLLEAYGEWMKVNESAIYNTHTLAPYKENQVCFTQDSVGRTNFIYLQDKNETTIPSQIRIETHCPKSGSTVTLLGSSQKLKWKKVGKGCVIHLPKELQTQMPCKYAWVFRAEAIE